MMMFLYDILFTIPLSVMVSYRLYPILGMGHEEGGLLLSGAAVIFSVIAALFRHLKADRRLMLSGVLAAALFSVILTRPVGEKLSFLQEHTWLLAALFTGVACFFVTVFLEHYIRIRIGLAAAGCAALLIELFCGEKGNRLCVCMTLLYALITLVDTRERLQKKEGDYDPKRLTVSVSPFILIFFLLAGVVKIPDEPYDWAFVTRLWDGAKDTYAYLCERLSAGDLWDTGTPYIGFSDRGAFGGNLRGLEYTAMEISSHEESDEKLYLSGRTFDSFDGREWTKTDDIEFDDRSLDTVESLAAVIGSVGEDDLPDLVKRVSVRVEYRGVHTTAMFLPPKSVPGQEFDSDVVLTKGGDYAFLDKARSRKPFTAVYYRLNRDSDEFLYLLENHSGISEDAWEKARKRAGDIRISYTDYLDYRRRVYDKYATSVELSPELTDYLDGYLKKAGTDIDKLKSIEAMLSEYAYSDSPGELPQELSCGSEFLDYFLLEKKEGYCSYFATSFVLLARAYGIPARYVQGFCVPMGIKRTARVSSVMAHAWPEAYIDGVGWIAFEPTPGMRSSAGWEIPTGQREKTDHHSVENDVVVSGENNAAPEGIQYAPKASQIGLFIMIAAVTAFGLFLTSLIISRTRYYRMDERERTLFICHRCMEQLQRHRLAKADYETIPEYGLRLKEELPSESLFFLDIYDRIMYSGCEVTMQDREDAGDCLISLKKALRDRFFTTLYTLVGHGGV